MKVRVQGAPIWSKTFAAVGMSPTVIAYDEIYNAIQNGVINAGENEAAGVEAMKFYEVGPNLNMTQHAITIRPICFSGKTFKKLPPDLQAAIVKAGKEAGAYGRQIESGEDQKKLEAMQAAGKLKMIPFTDRAQMKKLADPVMADYAKEIGADRDLQQDQQHVIAAPQPARDVDHVPRAGFFMPTFVGKRMHKLIHDYARVLNILIGISVALLVVPVTLQMISRFTALIPAWIWTEEMARFLFIWMVMLGAMVGVREATHFEVDVWPQLKPRPNAVLRIVSMIFVLVFAFVFVYYGIKFVQFGWNQTSELADLPMAYIFIAWPLTGVTWLVFGIQRLVNDVRIVRFGPDAR